MSNGRLLLLIATLAVLLTACGDADPSRTGAPAGKAPADSAAAAAQPEVDAATRGMVSGVAAGRAEDAAVDLKFELKSRPEVGQPLTIDVVLLPQISSKKMNVTYLSEGLTVQPSSMPSQYEAVQPGSVYRHQATVVPRDDGVFYVSAIVMVQTDTEEITRTFSIPVVVGGPPDSAADSAAP